MRRALLILIVVLVVVVSWIVFRPRLERTAPGPKPAEHGLEQLPSNSILDEVGTAEEPRTIAGVEVSVSMPGRYRIGLEKPLPGYLAPDEQSVDVEAGKLTEVVMRLTRKP